MTERPDLEAELRALGSAIDVPPAADVTKRVRRELQKPRRLPKKRIAFVIAVALLGIFALTPPGQAVVAQVFRFAGIELRQPPGPTLAPSPVLPGEHRMSLDQARRTVSFPLLVAVSLGQPTEVVVSDGGRLVSLSYPGIRMDQVDGQLDPIYVQKFVASKDVTRVTVNGRLGLWIAGPHELLYVTRDGKSDVASARLTTGNTLVWDTGRVAARLEGAFDLAHAVAIANSAK